MTLSQLLRLTRPRTLVASLGPVLLGASFSSTHYQPATTITQGVFQISIVFLIVLLAQVAVNVANEYYDYLSGLDKDQIIGNSGSITRDGLTPNAIGKVGIYCAAFSFVLGIYLAWQINWLLLLIGIACFSIGYGYSAGPYPISNTPLGEVASGTVMGLTIVLLSAYAWTHTFYWDMLIPAIPSLILVAAIMMTNNIRDIKNDQKHGRRTLAIIVGKDKAIHYLELALRFTLAWTVCWMILGKLPWLCTIALFAFFKGQKALHILKVYSDERSLDQALSQCAQMNFFYSIFLSIGLWAHFFLKSL